MLSFSLQAFTGQLLLGLINGGFYAILSLGLAIIFGLLNVINFTHGAQYMLGAVVAWLLLTYAGVGYWGALVLAPLAVGLIAALMERLLLRRIAHLDHLYGLLLTFGLAMIIEGLVRNAFSSAGLTYRIPALLTGGWRLPGLFLPYFRVWSVFASLAVCVLTWLLIEKTKLGALLRAATEQPALTQAFGIRVPLLITLTYAFGAALAALAGVMAAPIYAVNAAMGSDLLVVVFAVVVIGGLGSIFGAIITGFGLGVLEALTKLIYPEASSMIIFLVMVVVLIFRPAGLFGRVVPVAGGGSLSVAASTAFAKISPRWIFGGLALVLALAPLVAYPVFVMKVLCFALFAAAVNLVIGHGRLMSLGHAAYFGVGAYATAHAAKVWQLGPGLAILFGSIVALLLALLFGRIAIRRQGIYFAMITIALAQLVYFACLQAPFTHGEDGIQAVPRGALFGFIDLNGDLSLYVFVSALVFIGFMLIWRIVHSPFGEVVKALRGNEARAISLGYQADRYKLILYAMSGLLAGLAGGLKVLVFQIATLADVHIAMSGDVVLMVLVGGLGTFLGPLLGALVVVGIQDLLASVGTWVGVVQGVIFVICVLFFQDGITGGMNQLVEATRMVFAKMRPRLDGERQT